MHQLSELELMHIETPIFRPPSSLSFSPFGLHSGRRAETEDENKKKGRDFAAAPSAPSA